MTCNQDCNQGRNCTCAKSAPAIPEGWALVPVEPTDDMIGLGCDAADTYRVDMARAWEAMLAAAPEYEGGWE